MSNTKVANIRDLSWSARFALIDHFKPSDEMICEVFGVDKDELNTARDLRGKSISVDTTIDVITYESFFNPMTRKPATTIHKPARTATRKTTGGKRGKRGDKINAAFAAVTMKPVPAEIFAKKKGVSLAVLRQAKRFDKTDKPPVHVKKSKQTGKLMIWRETTATK